MNTNAPLSQVDVEMEIMRLVKLLEAETEAFAALAEDEAKKDAAHKHAWATKFITNTSKTQKEREAWADYQLETETYVKLVSRALMNAKKQRLESIRTSLDALRTIAANIRAMS